MNVETNFDADVVIAGAGMAGSTVAYLLAKQNLSVILIDRQEEIPSVFKAEKIESDQAEFLRNFGLLEQRRPCCDKIGEILKYHKGTLETVVTGEQYGIRYHDTVNQLRTRAIEQVDFRVARVAKVVLSESSDTNTLHNVVLDNGEVLS